MNLFYKLNEDKSVSSCSGTEWSNTKIEHISYEEINDHRISTIFIGLNHSWDDGEPLIFETMIFNPPNNGHEKYCRRYPTWDTAVDGHKKAVEWVKNGCKEEEEFND